MGLVRCILFAKGAGADTASYKPNRDESQWWSRRDALVRCVAAFLFGPPSTDARELILLFDEDWSRMHMHLEVEGQINNNLIPTEHTIVSLLKKATKTNGTVSYRGLKCQLVQSHTGGKRAPKQFDSKRAILDWLQKNCSFDYLKEVGLNIPAKIALKKFNKGSMEQLVGKWQRRTSPTGSHGANHRRDEGSAPSDELTFILRELLQPSVEQDITRVVAVSLHESSSSELPCWGRSKANEDVRGNDCQSTTQLCLLLGAVRDMTTAENKCLEKVCCELNVPQAAVRLGAVPEFTSKILSVVAYHHANQRLYASVDALLTKSRKRDLDAESLSPERGQALNTALHFIAIVPIESKAVHVDLDARNRTLWSLVRCVVSALWRSRFASGSNPSHDHKLANTLTLYFSDETYVTLHQHELVNLLAEKHQAAPSEYQVLHAIKHEIEKGRVSLSPADCAKEIFSSLRANETKYLLDLDPSSQLSCLTDLFYSGIRPPAGSESQSVAFLFDLDPPSADASEYSHQVRLAFHKAAKALKVRRLAGCFKHTLFCDATASAITMLQHFSYQKLLIPVLREHRKAQKRRVDKDR